MVVGVFGILYVFMADTGPLGTHAFDPATANPSFYPARAGDVLSGEKFTTYPDFNAWLYSLDLFIPVLDLGMDSYWRPRPMWLYIATVVEQFLGAIAVALAVAGFTGLLSRDEPVT